MKSRLAVSLWIGVLVGACNTGLVSIGDDAALECEQAACGEPPSEPPMCLNGLWGWGYACDLGAMQCVWQGVCPEAARECSPTECGPAPSVVAECMGGPGEGASCLSDASGTCRWTAVVCRSP